MVKFRFGILMFLSISSFSTIAGGGFVKGEIEYMPTHEGSSTWAPPAF